ncbi:MAG: hypothetical protein ABI480_09340 [Chitinophagaceae bacterium]
MKKIIIILLLLPAFAFSQKVKAHVITSAGILAGATETQAVFSFTGGVAYKNYFTGIGIAYDRYRYNSIPVFADWRFNFGENKVVFVYLAGGYNFPGSYQKEEEAFKTKDKMKGGLYTDAGLGYRFPAGKMHRFILSAGFSRKNMTWERKYTYPFTIPQQDNHSMYEYKLHFNRFETKFSWEIGR